MKLRSVLAALTAPLLLAGCSDAAPAPTVPDLPGASHYAPTVQVVCNTFLSVQTERYVLPVGMSATCYAASRDSQGNLQPVSGSTSWSSSDPATVSVSAGTIAAHRFGSARISVVTSGGGTASTWVDAIDL